MTTRQKAIAIAAFAVLFSFAIVSIGVLPGAFRRWSASGRQREGTDLHLPPCAQQGFISIQKGFVRHGRDRLDACPPEELKDPRLQLILAGLDAEEKEFNDIVQNWHPEFTTLFANESGLNPQLGEDKIRLIDQFVEKHPDSYYSELLTYVKALHYLATGDFKSVIRTLDAAPSMNAMAEQAAYLRALAALRGGDRGGLEKYSGEYAQSHPGTDISREILLLQAYSLHEQGRADDAAAMCLKVASETGASGETRWHAFDLMSRIYAAASRPADALNALVAAVKSAGDEIAGLDDVDFSSIVRDRGGAAIINMSPDDRYALANFFYTNKKYFDAIWILRSTPNAMPPDARSSFLLAAASVEAGRAGDADDALKFLDAAAPALSDKSLAGKACVLRARALLRRGIKKDRKFAESMLKGCAVSYPGAAGEALEHLIRLAPAGDKAAYLDAFIKYAPGYNEMYSEEAARARLLRNRKSEAYDAYGSIVANFPKGKYADDALFWMGKIDEWRGDAATATEHFKELRDKYPYSDYYFVAGSKLREGGNDPGPELPGPPAVFPTTESGCVRDAYSFMALGYNGLAQTLFEKALKGGEADADAAAIGLSRLERARGNMPRSVKVLENRIIDDAGFFALVINHPDFRELLYPTLFYDNIKAYAERNGVDPMLALGVIRQESRFDPAATSHSNAKGLMQIIPSTGSWIATQRKDAGFSAAGLYDAKLNVDYGTWYLRYLLNKFRGIPEAAVAAYNGGPGNVSRWIRAFGGRDMDYFIGSIPRDETRDYVLKVMHNYIVYTKLTTKK